MVTLYFLKLDGFNNSEQFKESLCGIIIVIRKITSFWIF